MRTAAAALLVMLATAPAYGQAGQSLYIEHCAPCHGAGGHDGFAANLAVPRLPHAPDDTALANLIRNGFPGTDMPPAFGVTESEIRLIVTYVRSLGRAPARKTPGNAARGEQIYSTSGNCASCHMLRGKGGRQGPDLSEIGARRGASHLRQSLVEPEAALPHDYLLVRVATNNGRTIAGVRLNEDTFSIQMRDLEGAIHSFAKSELARIDKEFGKTTMPSYKTLAASEIEDLVAFLSTLRGDL